MLSKGDIVLIGGVRTAIGNFGGSLKDFSSVDLGVIAVKGCIERSGIDPAYVDSIIMGNMAQTDRLGAFQARAIGIKAGLPVSSRAITINRLCGTGMSAIAMAAKDIILGDADVVIAGGSESFSQAPYLLYGGVRWNGYRIGHAQLEDAIFHYYHDFNGEHMGETAENLVERFKISRESQDEYAYLSQMRAWNATKNGILKDEIIPVEVKTGRKGETKIFDIDEYIKPETTIEKLSKLPPVFKKDGTITAGNASGINDAGAAILVTSEKRAVQLNLKPMGRIVDWAIVGVEPSIMGIGPVPATREVLKKTGMNIFDIDLFEINEAFAAVVVYAERELGIDRNILNVNGGAISLGHPVAATGIRLVITILYEMKRRNARYGLCALCIGGGQGMAIILENYQQ